MFVLTQRRDQDTMNASHAPFGAPLDHKRFLKCRTATSGDVSVLARMNEQLIKDEQSRNSMSNSELEARMHKWLEDDWQAALYEIGEEPVGYILFQYRYDEYRPSIATAYVRQFFINREQRGKGIGRRAFELATDRFFPDVSTVVIDVLEANAKARAFWEAVGFEPYCTTMNRTARA